MNLVGVLIFAASLIIGFSYAAPEGYGFDYHRNLRRCGNFKLRFSNFANIIAVGEYPGVTAVPKLPVYVPWNSTDTNDWAINVKTTGLN